MELDLSTYFSEAFKIYKNPSQIARNVTEKWASHNIYCPRCGLPLQSYGNNTKVNDFYCNHYEQDFQVLPIPSKDNFQLKSTKSFPHNHFPSIITGASYQASLSSLEKGTFPSLILLHYDLGRKLVQDGLFIHRLSVTRSSIIKRVPLTRTARRADWVGANILLDKIPEILRIPVIQRTEIVPKKVVMDNWLSIEKILKGNLESRGWISEVMLLVERLPEDFTLDDIYSFDSYLENLFPNNKHIRDKIRQQLQLLRDRGYIKFVGRGRYQKLSR